MTDIDAKIFLEEQRIAELRILGRSEPCALTRLEATS
jgi:hypothetical protein